MHFDPPPQKEVCFKKKEEKTKERKNEKLKNGLINVKHGPQCPPEVTKHVSTMFLVTLVISSGRTQLSLLYGVV